MANEPDDTDDTGDADIPAETAEDVVRRVLEENDVDAERALAVLVATIAARHVDVELRKLGRRPPWPYGNARVNAIIGVQDALHEQAHKGCTNFDTSPLPDQPSNSTMNVQRMLMRLLSECQFMAEQQAGMSDDDEPRPWMRLVTD
jgi:hypothetical protein